MKRTLFALLLIALLASSASARVRWLSPRGSNDSTQAWVYDGAVRADTVNAWRRLGYADDMLEPGDTLLVMGGHYVSGPDSLTADTARNHFHITSGGTSYSEQITVKAYGDSKAYIAGVGSSDYTERIFFYIDNGADWVTIDGWSYLNPTDSLYLVIEGRSAGWVRNVTSTDSCGSSTIKPDIKNVFTIEGNPAHDEVPADYCEHIKITGIEFDGHFPAYTKRVVNTSSSPYTLSLKDMDYGGNTRYGVYPSLSLYDTITSCYIHDIYYPCGALGQGVCNCPSLAPPVPGQCYTGLPPPSYAQGTGEAIYLNENVRFAYIANNTLENAAHALVQIGGDASTIFNKFVNNKCSNLWGGGVYVNFSSRNNLIEGNVICHAGESTRKTKSALSVAGSANTVRKNVVYSPSQSEQGNPFDIYSQPEGSKWRKADSNFVYNNTVFGCNTKSFELLNSDSSCANCSIIGNRIINNIFYHSHGVDPIEKKQSEIVIECGNAAAAKDFISPSIPGTSPVTTHYGDTRFLNNCIKKDIEGHEDELITYRESPAGGRREYYWSLANLQTNATAFGYDPYSWNGNISLDPMLTDETPDTYGNFAGWWHLLESSPCIDAGRSIGDTIGAHVDSLFPGYGWDSLAVVGTAHDIGAYEFPIACDDSLYITNPSDDSLSWGNWPLGTSGIFRTVRLINHCADSAIGTATVTNNYFYLNTTKKTLNYRLGHDDVFEFTVMFYPMNRGSHSAYIWYTNPFDSTYLSGTGIGGYKPNPMPSKLTPVTISHDGQWTGAIRPGSAWTRYDMAGGSSISGGASLDDISEGCWRPTISGIVITPDTTSAIIHWHTDSLSTHWIDYGTVRPDTRTTQYGNATSHADTLMFFTGDHTFYYVTVNNCRTLDPSCCVDSVTVGFTTPCVAMSTPYNVVITQEGDSIRMAFDTRSSVNAVGKWRISSGAWAENDASVPDDPDGSFSFEMTFDGLELAALSTYYLSIKSVNACNDEKAYCDSITVYTDANGDLTDCPTVIKSGFATQAITSGEATLHFHTNLITAASIRWHETGNNPWIEAPSDGDSTQHTITLGEGLESNHTYVWESRVSTVGCSASAYADSTQFITACPTVAISGAAAKAITAVLATFTCATDYLAHVHFRYALYASSSYTYRHDADADSLGHTVSVASLTPNHTRYKVQFNSQYAGCDTTAFGGQIDFYTTCATFTVSDKVACYVGESNWLELNTGTRVLKIQFRYRVTSVTPDTWTTLDPETTAISGPHCSATGALANSTGYTWEWRQYDNECGDGTASWQTGGTATTNSSGNFTGTCNCGGA